MTKEKRFVFLSEDFYQRYPSSQYPEIEQKQTRPYIQVCVEINGTKFAIPLRSDIHHPHVLRQNEFDALRGKDFKIKQKMQKYIDQYKSAKITPEIPIHKVLLKYSTLQYFEEYL